MMERNEVKRIGGHNYSVYARMNRRIRGYYSVFNQAPGESMVINVPTIYTPPLLASDRSGSLGKALAVSRVRTSRGRRNQASVATIREIFGLDAK